MKTKKEPTKEEIVKLIDKLEESTTKWLEMRDALSTVLDLTDKQIVGAVGLKRFNKINTLLDKALAG